MSSGSRSNSKQQSSKSRNEEERHSNASVSKQSNRDDDRQSKVSNSRQSNRDDDRHSQVSNSRQSNRDDDHHSNVSQSRQSNNLQTQRTASKLSVQSSSKPSRQPSRQNDNDDDRKSVDSYDDDIRRAYSSSNQDRDLVNKSRSGYIGTEYITDVKQYFNNVSFEGVELKSNKVYLEDLLADFRKLLKDTIEDEDDKLHDVEFVENEDSDKALPGHQQLLTARSATFEALFKRLDKDNNENYLGFRLLLSNNPRIKRILLPQSEPKISLQLMEAALHYMYWGNIDSDLIKKEKTLILFFEVSSFLDLKELRRHLAEQLEARLLKAAEREKDSNEFRVPAIEYLTLSVRCGCKYLKQSTIKFIVDNKSKVLKSGEWKKFIEIDEYKQLVKEIYQVMVEKSNKSS